MPLEFDGTNKIIKILEGTSSPLSALTIYSQAMDWADNQGAMCHIPPMYAVGKAPLGGGVYTDSIFVLQNGWKIKLYNGNYQFIIVGTIITDDETSRTVPPDYGNVEVVFQVTSQGTLTVTGSGITEQDKDDIRDRLLTDGIKFAGADITSIKNKTLNLPSDPASETSVSGVKNDITLLKADVYLIKTGVETMNPKLDTITNNVYLVKTGIDIMNPKINTVISGISGVEADVQALSPQLISISGVVNEIKSATTYELPYQIDNVGYNVGLTYIHASKIQIVRDLVSRIDEIELGRWKLENNEMTMYRSDGATVLQKFKLYNKQGQPAEVNIYERVPI